MARGPTIKTSRNILMELRKVCQHTYLAAPDFEDMTLDDAEQHKRLISGSGKLAFLKLLLPKLKERGHRVLLFSQFKLALDRIEDFLIGEGVKYLRLDGDLQQAQRQKDMDAFNAPGSDYFVFLLTTRAGGVGINLATADTVIIFDPDFNPHQDLQAIARSHRYGQTKKVLVFKLMTKNSCEERIIQAGKKKMVLDHLVVQSIDAQHEEGDIDSILLHGAAALYEKEVDGVAPSDVVYNSKNVDEMIDRVEQEAEEVAAQLAEKDRLEAEAVARGEKIEASKETKSFGFAKIWEADQNGLAEVHEANEDEELEQDEAGLNDVMEHVAAEQLRREAEEARMRANAIRARRTLGKTHSASNETRLDGFGDEHASESDTTPKKGDGKGKKRGKKRKAGDASDEEFAPQQLEESDSDESFQGEVESELILDEHGRPILIGAHAGGPGAVPAPQRPRKSGPTNGQSQVPQAAVNGAPAASGSRSAPAGGAAATSADGTAVDPNSHAAKIAAKTAERRKLFAANAAVQLRARADPLNVAIPAAQPPLKEYEAHAAPGPDHDDARRAALIKQGRYDAQWLYHILRQFGYVRELNYWSRAALDTVPLVERSICWDKAAAKVNAQLRAMGQEEYFARNEVKYGMMALIESKEDWVDAPGDEVWLTVVKTMLEYPDGVARSGPGGTGGADPAGPAVRAGVNGSGPSGAPAGSQAAGNSGAGSAQNALASASGQPAMIASNPPPVSLGNGAAGGPSRPGSAAGITNASGSGNSASVTTPPCPMCNNPTHTFAQCSNKPPIEQVRAMQRNVYRTDSSQEDKDQAMRQADWILGLYRQAGLDGATPVTPPTSAAPAEPQIPATAVRNDSDSNMPALDVAVPPSAEPQPSAQTFPTGPSTSSGNDAPPAPVPAIEPPAAAPATPPVRPSPAADIAQPTLPDGPRTRRARRSGVGAGTKADAIEVADDSDGDEPTTASPVKRVKSEVATGSREPSAAPGPSGSQNRPQGTPGRRGRPKRFGGCEICSAPRFHPAADCPVVARGSGAIDAVLQRFQPTHPLYDVLVELRERARRREVTERRRIQQAAAKVAASLSTPVSTAANPSVHANHAVPALGPTSTPLAQACPFCLTKCGRSIRECAEAHGGRQALKKLLRDLGVSKGDDPESGAVLSAAQEARKDALYAAYTAWPR